MSAPEVVESPTTDTALPPTATGTVTGRPTWLPPAVNPSPEVEPEPEPEPEDPEPGVEAELSAPEDEESPTTDTALPPTTTGAVTGAVAWLPPAAESSPEVEPPAAEPELEDPEDPAPGVEAELSAPEDEESPTTDTALPPATTGAVTGAVAWLPPAAESSPEVEPPAAEPPAAEPEPEDPAPAVEAELSAPEDEESPSTEMLLPLTLTGTETARSPWLPPPTEPVPSLVDDEGLDDEPCAELSALDELESPMRLIELPETVTGTAADTATWLPPRAPSAPEVFSSAEACPAKNRIPPPTMRAVCSPRRTYACMVLPS
ncbi:hypothetical protein GCM10025782_10220 [Pedococcus ginsenosidimutans]|uniref:Uncharacterized protein n=1 Tax=Pedococcus ginsenosidimutans TaxID=490570 RepID=A0ABP8XV60_9MICO